MLTRVPCITCSTTHDTTKTTFRDKYLILNAAQRKPPSVIECLVIELRMTRKIHLE